MTTMTATPGFVTGGVDTHLDIHVASALDHLGGVLGTASFPTTSAGYVDLLGWLRQHGPIDRVGVEGTGSYGSGLAQHLRINEVTVIEVSRPSRQVRRRHGKSDVIDAIAAARAVLAGEATTVPKSHDGSVEALRTLKLLQRSANKARVVALNQLHNLVVTAPDDLRARLRDLGRKELLSTCMAFRIRADDDSLDAITRFSLRELAHRVAHLEDQLQRTTLRIARLTRALAPQLLEIKGIGPDVASTLLVTIGDNPERMRHEKSFASLCGTSPIQASSGKRNRHRLNRGGDRQANAALWRVAIVRMGTDQRTRDYVARRVSEGKNRPEIIRCLKRYIAREVFNAITSLPQRAGSVEVSVSGDPVTGPDRHRSGTMDHAVEASAQRVRDHLRRPIPGRRNLLMETARNTVYEIDPRPIGAGILVRRSACGVARRWKDGRRRAWADQHEPGMGGGCAVPVVEPVVTEEKLRQLLDEGSESAQLDFKQQLELSVQRDKVELAKDVGAMQVEGGYFVVGATDTGQPSGAMTTAVAARFDEASVRNIVKKWIPEPFDIRIGRHVLSTTATSFSSTSPQIPTACACSALTGSTLTPAASRPRCSVPATSTHATAPRTNEWHSTTSPESCASLADVEKDKWGREIIETLQPQLALGPQAQQLARGPITNYALQLPLDTFEATTVEVLRAGDDMALRRVLNDAAAAASEELHRAGTMSEDLEPLLDRVAAVVAIGLAYVRRTEFDLAVAALARIYELGFDRSGYRAHCPHRDW